MRAPVVGELDDFFVPLADPDGILNGIVHCHTASVTENIMLLIG